MGTETDVACDQGTRPIASARRANRASVCATLQMCVIYAR